jgi:two-component system CitB family response regulator
MTQQPPIHVIIAEDNPQNALIQQTYLQRIEGFELVGIAHSIADAEALMEIFKPDLLLLDVYFPSGNGMQFLRHLRANDCATDVILITAAKEVEVLKAALHGGVFDYILKPLVFERFQTSLANYLQHNERLKTVAAVAQTDLDDLMHRPVQVSNQASNRLPKGIDDLTLNNVLHVISEQTEAVSAEQIGNNIGASQTTARRYLEYLVGLQEISVQIHYGSVGRPERLYRLP